MFVSFCLLVFLDLLFVHLFVCLFICMFIGAGACLPGACLSSVYLSTFKVLPFSLPFFYLSFIFRSVYPRSCPLACDLHWLSHCLSFFLFFCFSAWQSVCMSVFMYYCICFHYLLWKYISHLCQSFYVCFYACLFKRLPIS